jgi:hypothetical protein
VQSNDGGRIFFSIFILDNFKSLQSLLLHAKERKREREREREKERALELVSRYVITRLFSLFPISPILAMLVSKGVTAPAPSSNRNTSNNNTSSKKKFKNSKSK